MQGDFWKKRYWSSRNLDKPIVAELLLEGFNKDALLKEIEKYVVYKSNASTPIMTCNYFELSCKDIIVSSGEFIADIEKNPNDYQELMMFKCMESEV